MTKIKKKIILVGGGGFIGTNFYKLFKDQYDLIIYDIGDYACTLFNGLWDMDNPQLYRGDIKDYENTKKLFYELKPDYVINFAAKTHVDRSIFEDVTFLNDNVVGVENLIKICDGLGIHLTHISTDEVYGDRDEPCNETTPLVPSSPYSASKAAADLLINAYKRTFNSKVSIVRPSNTFGPYQYPEKVIPFFIRKIIEGSNIPVYGDGEQYREWTYVDDVCRGIEMVALNEHGIFNVGSGFRLKNNELASMLLEYFGKGADKITYVTDRPGHDTSYSLDSSKIRKLGWKPTEDILEKFRDTIEFFEKNYDLIRGRAVNSHIDD